MEQELRFELIKAIPELNNSIYPTNAPEGVLRPYFIYTRINTNNIKTLEGYENKGSLSFMFSIMATKYSDMVDLRKKVENLIKSLPKKSIGNINKIFIEDINVNNVTEQYEHELGVNRGIIDFTIYY